MIDVYADIRSNKVERPGTKELIFYSPNLKLIEIPRAVKSFTRRFFGGPHSVRTWSLRLHPP